MELFFKPSKPRRFQRWSSFVNLCFPDKLQNEAMALHDEKQKTEVSVCTRVFVLLMFAWTADGVCEYGPPEFRGMKHVIPTIPFRAWVHLTREVPLAITNLLQKILLFAGISVLRKLVHTTVLSRLPNGLKCEQGVWTRRRTHAPLTSVRACF